MNIGTPELLIILVVVLLLFGAGRISRIGGDLGTAIREFRRGLNGEEEPGSTPTEDKPVSKDTTAS